MRASEAAALPVGQTVTEGRHSTRSAIGPFLWPGDLGWRRASHRYSCSQKGTGLRGCLEVLSNKAAADARQPRDR